MQGAAAGSASATSAAEPLTLWERSYVGSGAFSAGGATSTASSAAWWEDPRKWMLLSYLIGGEQQPRVAGHPPSMLPSRSYGFKNILPPRRSLLELIAASL